MTCSSRQSHRLQQFDAGDRGGAGAVDDDSGRFQIAAGEIERIDERRRRDDRGAVLVVMEHGDIHELAQPFLDDKAVGRLDVLEIDAAEGRPEIARRN